MIEQVTLESLDLGIITEQTSNIQRMLMSCCVCFREVKQFNEKAMKVAEEKSK